MIVKLTGRKGEENREGSVLELEGHSVIPALQVENRPRTNA